MALAAWAEIKHKIDSAPMAPRGGDIFAHVNFVGPLCNSYSSKSRFKTAVESQTFTALYGSLLLTIAGGSG